MEDWLLNTPETARELGNLFSVRTNLQKGLERSHDDQTCLYKAMLCLNKHNLRSHAVQDKQNLFLFPLSDIVLL